MVDPGRLTINRIAPPVYVEQVYVNKTPVGLTDKLELAPGKNDLEFHYAGLSYATPERVRFKYKLEGYDRDWVDANDRRVAYYTNIPPGNYRFQVIACNNDGIWNETGTAIDLRLAPHFYQAWWFYIISALLIVLLAVALYCRRIAMLKQAEESKLQHLREREHELAHRVEEAVAKIKVLSGLLPICASCKNIRDDSGYWNQMEAYIAKHSHAEFSHGICPDCAKKLYPDFADTIIPKSEGGRMGLSRSSI